MNLKNGKTKPRALIFDLGDTLLEILSHDRERGLTEVLRFADGCEITPDLVLQLAEYGRALDKRFELLCVRHNIEYRQLDFHRLLYGRFGISFSIDEDRLEWEYWNASLELRPAPGIEDALRTAAAHGIRMAVISNTTYRGWVLEKELERLGLRSCFEFVMASADYGVRKPDPLLFEIALRRLDIKPEDAWYIGNSTAVDCSGAAGAGMTAVWYAADDIKRGRYETEHAKLPSETRVLSSWSDLTAMLDRG